MECNEVSSYSMHGLVVWFLCLVMLVVDDRPRFGAVLWPQSTFSAYCLRALVAECPCNIKLYARGPVRGAHIDFRFLLRPGSARLNRIEVFA